MNWNFFRKKKFYIPFIIILLSVGLYYRHYKKANQSPQYETVKVEFGNIEQTVEATGKIESVNGISLRFDVPGTVDKILVKEGQVVKTGQMLANLRLSELNASVAQASANLQQKLAGATSEDIKYYSAAMDAARATLEQTKYDADSSIKDAESAVATAKNNLQLAAGGDESQIIISAYGNNVATIQSSLPKLDDGLVQADTIMGIDNIALNDGFEIYLSSLDGSKTPTAISAYQIAKIEREKARQLSAGLTTKSKHADVELALQATDVALGKMNELLLAVSDVLKATEPKGTLTAAILDTKKGAIETIRASVASQYSLIIKQEQSIADAKNSFTSYSIALTKAENNLLQVKANKINTIAIKTAAYDQAVANYQGKINPPRDVDVASYRAALAQAVAARDKAIIKAPIDGVISNVGKKVGESVTGVDTIMKLLSPHYQIVVDIPETDVAKLKIHDSTTITLDAFGDDFKFTGNIIAIDPGSTNIQDVVYYKVTVTLVDTDKPIKPGMTANVSIKTNFKENVLNIPLRAVRTKTNGSKFVRLLTNGKESDVVVVLGLKANNNRVEILQGLEAGQEIIVSLKQQ